MFYAFIRVKGGNGEFVWVRDRIREANFRLSALVSRTGSISVDLVKAFLGNSNFKETGKDFLQIQKCLVLFHRVSAWYLMSVYFKVNM